MDKKTAVSKDIEMIREKAKLDTACKRVLANKTILAWIMKECLDEYKGYSCEEVMKFIEGTPSISSEAVHSDERIIGVRTEDTTLSEGIITYDICFTAIIPNTEDKIHLYVNIEAQNDYYPGYPLIKRGLYYCCRMISAQYEREFTKSHYENIKKVCSLWICISPPKNKQNSITQYVIEERNIVGYNKEAKPNYDLMNCLMLCLGDPDDTEGILKLLDVLMSSQLEVEKKKNILENDFEIAMTQEIESEVRHMCNYSDGIEARGIAKGEAIGLDKGINEMIESMRLSGFTEEQIKLVVENRARVKAES